MGYNDRLKLKQENEQLYKQLAKKLKKEGRYLWQEQVILADLYLMKKYFCGYDAGTGNFWRK